MFVSWCLHTNLSFVLPYYAAGDVFTQTVVKMSGHRAASLHITSSAICGAQEF